jgi:hypothetical protein
LDSKSATSVALSRYIKNIFSEGKLVRESVVVNFATTVADGKTIKLTVVAFHASYK